MIQFFKRDGTEVLTSYRQKIDDPTRMNVIRCHFTFPLYVPIPSIRAALQINQSLHLHTCSTSFLIFTELHHVHHCSVLGLIAVYPSSAVVRSLCQLSSNNVTGMVITFPSDIIRKDQRWRVAHAKLHGECMQLRHHLIFD